MLYNEEAFNISSQYYHNITKLKPDSVTKNKQKKLLKILLKRFSEELNKYPNQSNGVVKIKFKAPFWQEADDGYYLIKELYQAGNFDEFASEYCIYLDDIENSCDEWHTAYFEVIWDYKTYYELLDLKQTVEKIANIPEIKIALANFKQLQYQNEKSKICQKEGHQFSKWQKTNNLSIEAAVMAQMMLPNEKIEVNTWKRVCNRCGYTEKAKNKPQEIIEEENEKKRQEEIKKLERRLNELKSKK